MMSSVINGDVKSKNKGILWPLPTTNKKIISFYAASKIFVTFITYKRNLSTYHNKIIINYYFLHSFI